MEQKTVIINIPITKEFKANIEKKGVYVLLNNKVLDDFYNIEIMPWNISDIENDVFGKASVYVTNIKSPRVNNEITLNSLDMNKLTIVKHITPDIKYILKFIPVFDDGFTQKEFQCYLRGVLDKGITNDSYNYIAYTDYSNKIEFLLTLTYMCAFRLRFPFLTQENPIFVIFNSKCSYYFGGDNLNEIVENIKKINGDKSLNNILANMYTSVVINLDLPDFDQLIDSFINYYILAISNKVETNPYIKYLS